MYGGHEHLPLGVNTAGVIPPIFASSLLMFPRTVASSRLARLREQIFQDYLMPGGWLYNAALRRR